MMKLQDLRRTVCRVLLHTVWCWACAAAVLLGWDSVLLLLLGWEEEIA